MTRHGTGQEDAANLATLAFVLPPDVQIAPAEDLPDDLRSQLVWAVGDHVVTRPRSRAPSSVVDARMAGLLAAFLKPATIVDAVVLFSMAEGLDPRRTLEEAFPSLVGFIRSDLLVPASSSLAEAVAYGAGAGDRIGTFELVEPIDLLLDTEIYLARSPEGELAALKVSRPGATPRLRACFAHEATVLGSLGGGIAPRLFTHGEDRGRCFLALAWCRGVDAASAAAEARRRGGSNGRGDLARIAHGVAEAYAGLHRQGVLHGDVHPRNVIIDADGRATLIDFGHARRLDAGRAGPPTAERGGIDLYMEPELARTRLQQLHPPPATEAGEQYAVAALLFLLLTGAPTHRFGLEKAEMRRQVAEDPPLAFAELGVEEWPRAEFVLHCALAKEPAARYPSLGTLACALAVAFENDLRTPLARRRAPDRGPAHLLAEVIAGLERRAGSPEPIDKPPLASVNFGAAGVAFALLRVAGTRGDEKLLALADLWSRGALRAVAARPEAAFRNPELELDAERCNPSSLHHGQAGVLVVEALVAHSRGDEGAWRRAATAFMAATRGPRTQADVSFGSAGTLLACTALVAPLGGSALSEVEDLRILGDELVTELGRRIGIDHPIGPAAAVTTLGAAHGWAGMLHAILQWRGVTGGEIPGDAAARLRELAALAAPFGRGWCWPIAAGPRRARHGLVASWCNGAAGYVPLWLAAHRSLGDGLFEDLAIGAGWTAYEAPASGANLCCGLAGRAYALLTLHRHTGDGAWLERAQELAGRAAAAAGDPQDWPDSLYTGRVGVALLAADLERPERSAMPLFETEGWPV